MVEIEIKNNKFHKDTFDKTTEERRQKVLEVAIDEFASNGYAATSINDISRKANISIGAMYSYFASKEDLFLSIVNNAYLLMDKILKDVEENSKDIFDCIEKMVVASRKLESLEVNVKKISLDDLSEYISEIDTGFKGSPTKVSKIIIPHPLERTSQIFKDDYTSFKEAIKKEIKKNTIGM